ncbi:MAG: ATP-binding protein, partial [Bacteroidaceae bacterium]|nr:ATP-binding protein [Bacteroidaceae bacterium]
MGWTNSIRRVKLVLVVTAVMIAAVSLVVSHKLISDLKAEEVA